MRKSILNIRLWLVAAILSVAAALPFISTAQERRDRYFFDVTLTNHVAGTTQLYWDLGNGIAPINSSEQPLRADPAPVRYRYMISMGTIQALRLRPSDQAGAFVGLSQAQVVDSHNRVIHTFTPTDFIAGKGISALKVDQGTLQCDMSDDASEAYLDLKLDAPLVLPIKLGSLLGPPLRVALGVFVFILAAGLVLSLKSVQQLIHALSAHAVAHPNRAIIVITLMAVIIQCHPVLFLGRSFVSPNNGSLMLYAGLPTLPDSTQDYYEDGLGSDVGALLFQHLYYPMVEHDSLLKHGEIPLWNRYSMVGLPLLGQGMSMVGNPFHFITVLANGNAWAWDFNFILARWLFALGLGLAAFQLTRHLFASCLVGFAAPFISFFMFRLNHPASFAVCYAPWLVWSWVGLNQAQSARGVVKWLFLLILANWILMTSGTIKEAYMTIACLNFTGVILTLLLPESKGRRVVLLGSACIAGLIFCLLSAPLWTSFLDALSRSLTAYDIPRADFLDLRQVIGFFDDIFYRQNWADETGLAPSLNFLFLVGTLWWLASLRNGWKDRAGLALIIASLLPFSVVFGLVPSSVIIHTPFIGNIIHVGNTFSCPLLIDGVLMAAFGFRQCCQTAGTPRWWREFGLALALTALICATYFVALRKVTTTGFFHGYSLEIALAALVLPFGLRWLVSRQQRSLGYTALLICVPLLLWRHSQYQHTPFDRYVFNPGERANFYAPSPAIQALDRLRHEPARLVGWDNTLFPAYNTAIRWEGLFGVDALRNRHYDEFAHAGRLDRLYNWLDGTDEKNAPRLVPYHDLLNVGYYIAPHREGPHDIAGVSLVGRYDLDIYESPTVWPRAFFTDRVLRYTTLNQLNRRILAPNHPPFAAFEGNQTELPAELSYLLRSTTSNTFVPAHDFKLTGNNTSFTVDAPRAGVAVLTEAYYAKDFQVFVNGVKASYFRVNHAFKAVYLPRAGTYRIAFKYWPEHFTLGLILCGVGFVLLILLSWLTPRLIPSSTFGEKATSLGL